MKIQKLIFKKAKEKKDKWIVLPEASVSREVLNAGLKASKFGLCKVIFLGDDALKKFENKNIKVINPKTFEKLGEMQKFLFELRKEKGLTFAGAKKLLKDLNYFGVTLVKMGFADGMVSGKVSSSKDVIRPALQIIKTKQGIKTASSCMLMLGKKSYTFADCGIVRYPTAEQLCDIAKASAFSTEKFLGVKAKVGFLSFSTLGSGNGESVDLVCEAVKLLKKQKVGFEFEGPLQADSALNLEVAKQKAPKSRIAGFCNTLIFPNLDAGNIGYKLFREASGCECVGPITQGLAKPVNDLSRGANEKEILLSIATTIIQID